MVERELDEGAPRDRDLEVGLWSELAGGDGAIPSRVTGKFLSVVTLPRISPRFNGVLRALG